MKICLLVVDMQNGFLHGSVNEREIASACEYINHTAALLRQAGHIVVHIKDMESAGEMSEHELDWIEGIEREASDATFEKIASNAFWETGLEDFLREREVGLVVVSGFAAQNCVLFTFNGARERGFKSVFLQHGILDKRREHVDAIYSIRPTVSYPVIEYMLGK